MSGDRLVDSLESLLDSVTTEGLWFVVKITVRGIGVELEASGSMGAGAGMGAGADAAVMTRSF